MCNWLYVVVGSLSETPTLVRFVLLFTLPSCLFLAKTGVLRPSRGAIRKVGKKHCKPAFVALDDPTALSSATYPSSFVSCSPHVFLLVTLRFVVVPTFVNSGRSGYSRLLILSTSSIYNSI